jgi:putative transposase
MYYGSEFTCRILGLLAYHNQVTLEFSRPGKPTDNCHIESFNGGLRDECLNAHWFTSLADAKDKIAAWLKYYNESRPHRALNNLAPLGVRGSTGKWSLKTNRQTGTRIQSTSWPLRLT